MDIVDLFLIVHFCYTSKYTQLHISYWRPDSKADLDIAFLSFFNKQQEIVPEITEVPPII